MVEVYAIIYTSAVSKDVHVWTEGRSCIILIRSGVFGSEFPRRRMFSLRDARISVAEPISISGKQVTENTPSERENPEPVWVCKCVSGGVEMHCRTRGSEPDFRERIYQAPLFGLCAGSWSQVPVQVIVSLITQSCRCLTSRLFSHAQICLARFLSAPV